MWIIPLIIPTTLALNILLSSSESWVSQGVRRLQQDLEAQNHTVVLVAPLYSQLEREAPHDIDIDGGAFGHLLSAPTSDDTPTVRGVKNIAHTVKYPHVEDPADNSMAAKTYRPFRAKQFGQDPLDKNAWFVDESPSIALLVAYDIILPKFYPKFSPDIVILGPDQGLALTPRVPAHRRAVVSDRFVASEEMSRLSMVKNYPTIAISTADHQYAYFQKSSSSSSSSSNGSQQPLKLRQGDEVAALNLNFINERVAQLLATLLEKQAATNSTRLLPLQTSLNINFPSMNYGSSRCSTGGTPSAGRPRAGPAFEQIVFTDELKRNAFTVPSYVLSDEGDLIVEGEYAMDVVTSRRRSRIESEDNTFIDTASDYYKHRQKWYKRDEAPSPHFSDNEDLRSLVVTNDIETMALNDCMVTVTVNNLKRNGLGTNYFKL
ncbi:Survival protein SurE-like phosphatase/nucleotidase domain-containing protein [[Candida] zeylanoides]